MADFTVKTPAIAPDAFANVLQRKQEAENAQKNFEQQQRDARFGKILEAVQQGQHIAMNMMDIAKKKDARQGLSDFQSAMTMQPPAPPTASSTALPDAGTFNVQPSPADVAAQDRFKGNRQAALLSALLKIEPESAQTIAKSMAATTQPKQGTPPRSYESYLTQQLNSGLITPDEYRQKLGQKPKQVVVVNPTDGTTSVRTQDEAGAVPTKPGEMTQSVASAKIRENAVHYVADQRQGQFDERQWNSLGKDINALDKGQRSAIGSAGVGNQRAARALALLDDPHMDSVMLKYVESDLAGIMQGGAPHEVMLRNNGYENLATRWGQLKQQITSDPQSLDVPEVRQQLRSTIQGIIDVDNKVLDTNLGMNKEKYLRAVQSDPQRFMRMAGYVEQTKALGTSKSGGIKIDQDALNAELQKRGL